MSGQSMLCPELPPGPERVLLTTHKLLPRCVSVTVQLDVSLSENAWDQKCFMFHIFFRF
jgi:hypothetical protein